MKAVALGLLVVWFVTVFIIRSVVQKRATGDSGIRPGAFADDASGSERGAYLLLVVALAGGYALDVRDTGRIHLQTAEELLRQWPAEPGA